MTSLCPTCIETEKVHFYIPWSISYDLTMAPTYSKFLTRGNVLAGAGALTAALILYAQRQKGKVKVQRWVMQQQCF